MKATCNSLLLLQEPNLFLQLSELLIRLDKKRETKRRGNKHKNPNAKCLCKPITPAGSLGYASRNSNFNRTISLFSRPLAFLAALI